MNIALGQESSKACNFDKFEFRMLHNDFSFVQTLKQASGKIFIYNLII